jgi:ferredoxin
MTQVVAGARAASMTLQVDRIRCDGYGMCAELLPELIELDDWGYPIVRPDAVPDDLLGLARRAVDVCPVLALRLRGMPPRVQEVVRSVALSKHERDHRAIRSSPPT